MPSPTLEDIKLRLVCENLRHAEHVESERITFISIFTALVAGMLYVATTVMSDFIILSITLTLVIIALNIVCMLLVRKWTNVFHAHTTVARHTVSELIGVHTSDETALNQVFVFEPKGKICSTCTTAGKNCFKKLLSCKYGVFKTEQIILCYCSIILLGLVCMLIFFLCKYLSDASLLL